MNNAIAPPRTACHGCRAVSYELSGEDHVRRQRPLLLVGDGQVMREVMPGMMVSQPCRECGRLAEDGWLDGFVVPA